LREGLSESRAIEEYTTSDLVEAAERHAFRYANELVPNDPYYSQQWGLPMIRAAEAWAAAGDLEDVVVAVIDTGVDYLHPDLVGSIWTNGAEVDGLSDVDDDGNGYIDDYYGWDFAGAAQSSPNDGDANPMDVDGHGTHVAGIVAAQRNNGKGVAGVSRNARIMVLKVQADDAEEMESWDIISAIDYAIANGAKIVNCSFGGDEYSANEEDAFRDLLDAGVLTVCAAGNDAADIDTHPMYPAGFTLDSILSVAAGDQGDELAGFSNFGPANVDVVAPGQQIKSTIVGGTYTEAFVTVSTNGHTERIEAIGMVYSEVTGEDGITGQIIDCGQGYSGEFPAGAKDNIALIQRGNKPGYRLFYFSEKVTNAQVAGAVAVIIHNDITGEFSGTLGSPGDWVPVISISKEDGETILDLIQQQPVSALFNRPNDKVLYYTYKSGTSMAAPMVSGIAALMLGRAPSLGYLELKNRIMGSAVPVPSLSGKILSGSRVDAFSALCSSRILPGDVSCDARVDLKDGLIVLQLLSGLLQPLCTTCIPNGIDVDGDGRIGIADAIYILQTASGTGL